LGLDNILHNPHHTHNLKSEAMVDSEAVFVDNLPLVVVLTTAVTLLLTLQSATIVRLASTIYHRLLLSQLTVRSGSSCSSDTTVVTGLYAYPVKSLRAVSCTTAVIDAKGFVGDRRFLLVTPAPTPLIGYFGPDDATHRFLTQRQCPSLARIDVSWNIEQETLIFSTDLLAAPNQKTCTIHSVPLDTAPIFKTTLWGSIMTVQDMGDEVAEYLQKIVAFDAEMPVELADKVRLVVQHVSDGRTAQERFVPAAARTWLGRNPRVSFADGFPLYVS
jgi:uncharacterized protein YcbX